jgi:3-oxoacyl-[acyl-carrier-protein] synthase-3
VWIEFERRLHKVPIVTKLDSGRFDEGDYRALLLNLRPQVILGASWMARMISNFTPDNVAVRTWCLEHAVYGHTDYRMLDADYVASGGALEEIQQAQPNVGTEALSAWMYQRADQENPFDLLGAMYVIEGLSSRLSGRWRRSLADRLGMKDEQLSFLSHHAKHKDHDVTGPIDELLPAERLTDDMVDQIVRTAQVTARLYLLQLEELETH